MEKQTEIQIALRLRGDTAETIKAMAEEDDRSFAYIAIRLIEQQLKQLKGASNA